MQWYLAVLKNYVGFSGRARRKEYWMFTLINAIVGAIINVIQLILGLEFPFLSLIWYVFRRSKPTIPHLYINPGILTVCRPSSGIFRSPMSAAFIIDRFPNLPRISSTASSNRSRLSRLV